MFNNNTHRLIKSLLYFKPVTSPPTTTPSPKPFPFSLPFCTNTSNYSPSFPISYLINNLGFSPQSASKLCSTYPRHLAFKTPQKPDSVLTFFTNHGFSNTQLHNMIGKVPWLLSCDPYKRVLPKFQFFQSKGASTSDIVNLVSKRPVVLAPSLEKQLVPAYELYYRYLKSNKATFALLNHNPTLFSDHHRMESKIRMLIENGVTDSNIGIILRQRSGVFIEYEEHPHMLKVVEELKGLGFNPSKSTFAMALLAKVGVSKTFWNEKIDAFKKWGWSDEHIMETFRRQPHFMLASLDKINSVMSFWVNQLGWDALELVKRPTVIGLSLEGRIIPRALVVQYLLEKGLLKKNASLTSPFMLSDELFLDKFVSPFKEEYSYLFNMYKEKLNPAYTRD